MTLKQNTNDAFIVKSITFLVVGVILFTMFQIIRPFLGIIATAAILAVFLNPVYLAFYQKTGRKTFSGLTTVVLVFILIILPIMSLITNIFSEIFTLTKQLQQNSDWISEAQNYVKAQLGLLKIPADLSSINLNTQISGFLTFMAKNIGSIAAVSGTLFFNLFFTILTFYFLLVNQEELDKYLNDLSLFPKQYLEKLTRRAGEIINGTVRGYLLVVSLQSVIGITGFSLFGIPAAFLLGSLYGLSSLLPVIGGFIFWVPISLFLAFKVNMLTGVLLAIWFFGLGFIIENILSPKIIGKSTNLHQILVMFSVFGGIQYFGLLGMVLGPVVMALTLVALEITKEVTFGKSSS